MQIPRPSDDDKDLFRSLVPAAPDVEIKPMFGNLGAFVNGNMFMGLFGSDIGVKLIEESKLAQLWQVEGTGHFGPGERPMREFVALPAAWRTGSAAAEWIEESLRESRELPPKTPKQRKSPKR